MNKKKAIIKGVKKSLKGTDFNEDVGIWTSVGVLMSCIYCPCGEKCSGDDKCSKLLMDWYKESEE